MLKARVLTGTRLLFFSLIFVILAAPEWPAFQDQRHQIDIILGQRHFDFLIWEINALGAKGQAALAGNQTYLDETTRKDIVLNYVEQMGQVRNLEAQVNGIYTDPDIADPDLAARGFQEQIDGLRVQMAEQQPIAEAIIQEQVAAVLISEGFDLLGQAWPPVQMHMTPLPLILVVSPRDEIRQMYNIPVEHGLTVAERETIESGIYEQTDLSALVVPIGGLGFYPAMIVETGNVNFLFDVVAHEWAHHWLTFHPLGIGYAANPTLRTVNETVASIVGSEIGAKVIERYYPEFIPPAEPETEAPEVSAEDSQVFDFNGEMHETRVTVDELLGAGKVDEAEAYMEARRLFFWENGYRIRKLNQAYFAFYGAYADTPGEQGDDPIGPKILAIRENSPSLREFLDRMASVTSFERLEELALELSS